MHRFQIHTAFVTLLAASAVRAADPDPGVKWAWTGRELVVLAERGALSLDPVSGSCKEAKGLPFPLEHGEKDSEWFRRRIALLPLSGSELAVACVPDAAAIRLLTWNLDPGAWRETGRIAFSALGIEWESGSFLRGMVRLDCGRALFLFPSPVGTLRVQTEDGLVYVPGVPTVDFPGAFHKGRIPNQEFEALYSMGNTVLTWGCGGKQNPGYLWHATDDRWEALPSVPWTVDDKPFEGPTPRGGFAHCFSGSDLFIYGGHLTWSSAVGLGQVGLGGMAYSVREKRWRVLPGDGPGSGGVCWTGSEFVAIRSTRRASAGARLDPTESKWTRMNLEGAPSFKNDPELVWTGREVLAFEASSEEGRPLLRASAYDPATDRWRTVAEPAGDRETAEEPGRDRR